jgi:hypothetical protein
MSSPENGLKPPMNADLNRHQHSRQHGFSSAFIGVYLRLNAVAGFKTGQGAGC